MSSRLNKVAQAISRESPLDLPAETHAMLIRLKQELPVGTTSSADPAKHLGLVLANPTDADARLVLGDLLLESGDPRGELIALQSVPKPNRVQANYASRPQT